MNTFLLDELHRLGVSDKVIQLYRAHRVELCNYVDAFRSKIIPSAQWEWLSRNSSGAYWSYQDVIALNLSSMPNAIMIEHVMLHELGHWTGHRTREARPRLIITEQMEGLSSWRQAQLACMPDFHVHLHMEEIFADMFAYELACILQLSEIEWRTYRLRNYVAHHGMQLQAMGMPSNTELLNTMQKGARETAIKYAAVLNGKT